MDACRDGHGWTVGAILRHGWGVVADRMGALYGAIGDVSADRSYYEAIWPASQSCKLRTQKTGTYGSVPALGLLDVTRWPAVFALER